MTDQPLVRPSAGTFDAQIRTYFSAFAIELVAHEAPFLAVQRSAVLNQLFPRFRRFDRPFPVAA